jgi:hypothetical protein
MIKRPPVVHRKRPDDEQEQIRITKERMDTQLLQDQQTLQPNMTGFVSKQDMIQRLVPFHLYCIRDGMITSDMTMDVERIQQTMERVHTLLEQDHEQPVILGFLERLEQWEE